MRRLGGAGSEVYDHKELWPLILPPLRADLRLLDDYRPAALTPLRTPVSVFGGAYDHTCTVAELSSWADATSEECTVHTFPGGHHYLQEFRSDVLKHVADSL
jgi:surfactin synthase thioesterase subunit